MLLASKHLGKASITRNKLYFWTQKSEKKELGCLRPGEEEGSPRWKYFLCVSVRLWKLSTKRYFLLIMPSLKSLHVRGARMFFCCPFIFFRVSRPNNSNISSVVWLDCNIVNCFAFQKSSFPRGSPGSSTASWEREFRIGTPYFVAHCRLQKLQTRWNLMSRVLTYN